MGILSRIKRFFKSLGQSAKKILSFDFLKPKPKPKEEVTPKPKEVVAPKPEEVKEIKEEVKKPEEEGRPVTLTVSTELYVGDHVEKIEKIRQFPSRQDALANVEKLAKEAIDENLHRASEIAKSVSYRIDDNPESIIMERIKSDKKTRIRHKKK
jgi:outer membrane biosynthesis protein TonB